MHDAETRHDEWCERLRQVVEGGSWPNYNDITAILDFARKTATALQLLHDAIDDANAAEHSVCYICEREGSYIEHDGIPHTATCAIGSARAVLAQAKEVGVLDG